MINLQMTFTDVRDSEQISIENCFRVMDQHDEIELCAEGQEEANEWACVLKTAIG